jgi:hypothetical protein
MKTKILISMILLVIFIGCNKSNDMANDTQPGKSGSITRFAVSGNYMYVLDQNRIMVYSLQNSEQPKQVNIVSTDYGLETIIIYDGTIYVGSRDALYILNITVPEQPVVLSKAERDNSLQGGCDPVAVKDNYAYSTVKIIQNICGNVAAQSQLIVYNVSNKNNPIQVNSLPMSMPNWLGIAGDYLLVCDEGTDMIEIFDISNPANPQYFSEVDLIDPVDLIVNGNKMIVSTKTDFGIYDISDISQIRKIGIIPKS